MNTAHIRNFLQIILIVVFCYYFFLISWVLEQSPAFRDISAFPIAPLLFWAAFPLSLLLLTSQGRDAFWFAVYFTPLAFLTDFLGTFWRIQQHIPFAAETALLLALIAISSRSRPAQIAGMSGVLCGFFFFVLIQVVKSTAAIAGSGWVDFDDPNAVGAYMFAWPRLVGALLLVAIFWPRRTVLSANVVPMNHRSFPRFHALLQDLAGATSVPLPEKVCLTQDANVAVTQVNSRFGLGGERVLLLGAPLVAVLSEEALRGLLAHEFGHFSRKHLGYHVRAYQVCSGMKTLVADQSKLPGLGAFAASSIFGWGTIKLLSTWFDALLRKIGQGFEFEADRLAAETVGKREILHGLRDATSINVCLETFRRGLPDRFAPVNLNEFRDYCSSPAGLGTQNDALSRLQVLPTHYSDSHPSLRDRTRAVESLRIPESRLSPVPEQPAFLLFGESLADFSAEYSLQPEHGTIPQRSPRKSVNGTTDANFDAPVAAPIGAIPANPLSALEPASPIQRRAGLRKRLPFLKVFARISAIALVLFVLPLLLVAVHEDHDISSMRRIGFREMDTPRLDAFIPYYYAPGIEKEYADSRDIDRARRDYHNFTLDDGTVIFNYPVGPNYYLPDPDEIGPFIFCLAIIPPEVIAYDPSGTVSILETHRKEIFARIYGWLALAEISQKPDEYGFLRFRAPLSDANEVTILCRPQNNTLLIVEIYGARGAFDRWTKRKAFESHIHVRPEPVPTS